MNIKFPLPTTNLLWNIKGKTIPVQAYYRPRGFQQVESLRFQDNRHMKVVRLSALRTLYSPVNTLDSHFC